MASRRSVLQNIYTDTYTVFFHDEVNKFTCFYCGEAACGLDHQPALSRIDDYRGLNMSHEVYIKVPCCPECNSLAGNELHETMVERDAYIKRRLEDRYRKLLSYPEWADKEIRRYRGMLRTELKLLAAKQEWINYRLDYSAGINAFLAQYDYSL